MLGSGIRRRILQHWRIIANRPADSEYGEVPTLLLARKELLNIRRRDVLDLHVTGAIDTSTTEAEAKLGFLQQAEKWVDDWLRD